MQALRTDGLLYMRPLAEFAKEEESDTGRGDRFEGSTTIIQPKHVGKLIFSNPDLGEIIVNPLQDLAGPVRIGLNKTASCNVYCMVAVRTLVDGELVPSEVTRLGNSFVIVTNIREFIRRVVLAAKEENNGVSYLESGLVEYYDDVEYSGEIGCFRKRRSQFEYQSEFRIVVEPGLAVARTLFVGSLLDITSEVLPSSAALQGWRSVVDQKN